jgi:hypothetical protein
VLRAVVGPDPASAGHLAQIARPELAERLALESEPPALVFVRASTHVRSFQQNRLPVPSQAVSQSAVSQQGMLSQPNEVPPATRPSSAGKSLRSVSRFSSSLLRSRPFLLRIIVPL